MKLSLFAVSATIAVVLGTGVSAPAMAGNLPDSMAKPGGFPERPMTMIVPYGPGGG